MNSTNIIHLTPPFDHVVTKPYEDGVRSVYVADVGENEPYYINVVVVAKDQETGFSTMCRQLTHIFTTPREERVAEPGVTFHDWLPRYVWG